ncbi:MAG: Periplasmic serine endoprotease DegP-like [uncultured Thiotrichaceae bacterium]|uniref:Periplasmic serine endoprotease DegP-like n=1 Tax=uncultured Thiotrichaceae bacterium TaxID=298394 RepID=A0A6S6STI8_9GAMM|nr:MAG: Periplasmic serine endoprotease DegP-like [uncultured Thiotrichaceae bacterium]
MKKLTFLLPIALVTAFFIGGLTSTHAGLPNQVSGNPLPSLADMLENITPAVVNIHAEGSQVIYDPATTDPFLRELFGSRQREKKTKGTGSGIIVDARQGYIITNSHVVEDADNIYVTLNDNREFRAQLIGADPHADIAVLQISGKKLTALQLANSDKVRVGDFVVAIGNPYGIGQSVSSGIVSALGRNNLGIETYENFIQTDAPINPGNSGGALVNLHGELIGINTAILGGKGGGNVGIGFAIPVNMAVNIMDQLVNYGQVQRGQLGVYVEDLTPQFARELNTTLTTGAVITGILKDSTAEKAGLIAGDVITKINNRPIKNSGDVRNIVGNLRISTRIKLTVYRDEKKHAITAVIGNQTRSRNTQKEELPTWYR